ncbi:MAG TPA: hypothetical protein VMH80_25370 [Bryobacteraceae bacterium]|nr:hypothetical protein [Bryobacteraceae bacterium]
MPIRVSVNLDRQIADELAKGLTPGARSLRRSPAFAATLGWHWR